jgi:hypothetical protein
MTQDALEAKREQLGDLEKSEREARRLEEALGRGRVSSIGARREQGGGPSNGEATENGEEETHEEPPAYVPPHPGPIPARRKSKTPGMGLLSALSYTLHGMMDVDPETARRNSITKTGETISQVHSCGDTKMV